MRRRYELTDREWEVVQMFLPQYENHKEVDHPKTVVKC